MWYRKKLQLLGNFRPKHIEQIVGLLLGPILEEPWLSKVAGTERCRLLGPTLEEPWPSWARITLA